VEFYAMKTSPLFTTCLLLSGLLASVSPNSARAQQQEDFVRSVDAVRQLLESQEYEEALERLGRLKPLARDANQRLVVSLYEGLVLSNMGRRTQDRAQAAFRSALLQDPQASLPVKVTPRQQRTFEEVRAHVMRELAVRPLWGREGTALLVPAVPAEETFPPVAEPQHVQAGAPGEMDAADRLRWRSKLDGIDPSPATELVPVADGFGRKVIQPRVLVPAFTGGALLFAGGVFWGLARRDQLQLQDNDPSNGTTRDEARLIALRGMKYQTWGFSLAGAGGVALGVATVFYMLQVPNAPVSLGVGTNGTSALLKGTWP
jgi:hypothetical protein